MMHFTRMLQTTLQYDLGTNLYGVSYDWRFEVTNSELNIYYSNFQRIVEKAHNSTGRKVIIYAHSYGNIFTSWFLHNKVSQEWREKCIDRVVNINAPFGGSMESVFQITTGKPIGIFTKADNYTLLSAKQTRSFARHSPAVASLLPSAEAFGNMDEFLSIIGDEFSSETYHKLVQQEKVTMQRPNINSTCIFGVGIATPKQYIYNSSMDQATMIINGNGDGTVNLNSLIVAKKWAAENSNAQIEVVEINGAEHTAILWNNRFFEIVKQIINFSSPMLQLEKEKQHVVLKNVLLEGDLICVSQLPVWTCEKGYTPLYTAKFTKISMTCFLKNEDNGHHEDEVREAVQAGPFFELSATPNKIYKMRVLESCQHPQKMALLDFIIYYLTIFSDEYEILCIYFKWLFAGSYPCGNTPLSLASDLVNKLMPNLFLALAGFHLSHYWQIEQHSGLQHD
uniref:Uncharacterized protein n=1 Tax=Ditylenchus dipsaci TaxID=166011 RepID=A0A915E9Y1_9BILA